MTEAAAPKREKRIHIIGCDGTWQLDTQTNPTNVALLLQAAAAVDANGAPQLKKHFDGVASSGSRVSRAVGGATGTGLDDKIKEAYLHLAKNYESGDEIVLVGFSRGSYTVRSLNGMLYTCGIPNRHGVDGNDLEAAVKRAYEFYRSGKKPSSPEAQQFRAQHSIAERAKTNLALFDTVGALGIPNTPLHIASGLINRVLFRKGRKFHDTTVNRNTKVALQAASVAERRGPFTLTPIEKTEGADTVIATQHFSGDHAGVGGGSEDNKNKGLSDIAAMWMVDMLEKHTSVRFDRTKLSALFNPNALANPGTNFEPGGIWRFLPKSTRQIASADDVHPSVQERAKADKAYRPKALQKLMSNLLK